MATRYWLGGALAVAQVNTFTFAGTWEANDIIRVRVGSKSVNFTAGSTTISTVVSALVTAWNALSSTLYPEFAEVTASASTNDFILTADTPGMPFTITLHALESDGSTNGDAQTIAGVNTATAGTATTANTGPNNWDESRNWSSADAWATSAVPVDADTVIVRNSSIDILYGIDQTAVSLAALTIEQSFTGKLGLPWRNANGYMEYRPTYLIVGASADAQTMVLTVGTGDGAGSGRIKVDNGDSQTTVVVYNTGNPSDAGTPAFLFKGTHASNDVTFNRGSAGIAVGTFDAYQAAAETAVVATLRVGYITNPAGDANVRCGSGVTLTTIDKNGGKLEINSAATTITHTAGELTLNGVGVTVTTLNERGGTTYVTGTTTLTTANLSNAGVLDYSRDMRTKVVTNPVNIYGNQAKFIDPFKVTGSIVLDLEQGGALGNHNLGQHVKLTRGTPT